MRVLGLILLVTVAGCSGSNDQITCPSPESATSHTLNETPAQIAAAGAQLGHGSENEIAEVAAGVKARHPGATKNEISNYLVTAYCPTINTRFDISKAEKRQALDSFFTRVDGIVH